ncbi:hypothetical protein M1N11_03705 [Peptococcaceae bacterium]|nr:hypothetical protein [Peptococcaceae bacterium]
MLFNDNSNVNKSQKEKLHKAYQQEQQHVKKLHKVLESIHDIFNAENEREVFNKIFEILTITDTMKVTEFCRS